jgi:hypothetical protein
MEIYFMAALFYCFSFGLLIDQNEKDGTTQCIEVLIVAGVLHYNSLTTILWNSKKYCCYSKTILFNFFDGSASLALIATASITFFKVR